MSFHPRIEDFGPIPAVGPVKSSIWSTIVAYFAVVFSGAKGDQGGWESGARGM